MSVRIIVGDVRSKLAELPDESVHCVVTSPPYFGLRDYGVAGQIGLEPTPAEFVAVMVEVFREVRRVLRADGTLWLNLGDSYAAQRGGTAMPAETLAGGNGGKGDEDAHRGHGATHAHRNAGKIGLKHKDLIGIPWRVAFALQADGWWLHAGFNERWDAMERTEQCSGMRTKRSVWTVATQPFSEAHFATFPPALIEPCILAGCPKDCCAKCGAPVVRQFTKELVPTAKAAKTFVVDDRDQQADANDQGSNRQKDGHKPGWINRTETTGWSPTCSCDAGLARGTVLDPFGGAGTTGLVADRLQRNAILIELNPEYAAMAGRRIRRDATLFSDVAITA